MFGKLLKYEWKAMMKTMLPIYGATMVLAAVERIPVSEYSGRMD